MPEYENSADSEAPGGETEISDRIRSAFTQGRAAAAAHARALLEAAA